MNPIDLTSVPRRLHVGDAMILVAALGVALVILRWNGVLDRLPDRVTYWNEGILELCHLKSWSFSAPRSWVLEKVLGTLSDELALLIFSLLISFVPAFLLIQLRGPRRPIRLFVRQPLFGVFVMLMLGSLVGLDLHFVLGIDPSPSLFLGLSSLLFWLVRHYFFLEEGLT